MTRRRLRSIKIEGYTSIRSAQVELGDLNVLVGANGAGKSNFISAFALLGRIVDEELNLFVGQAGGASTLLHAGAKGKAKIRLQLDFDSNGYEAELIPAARDELIFGEERVWFRDGGHATPFDTSLGRGHRETRLGTEMPPGEKISVAHSVVDLMRGCRVFHFHDTTRGAPVKQTGYVSDDLALRPDAGNLAAVLLRLRQTDRAAYLRIVGTIKQVAPFFRDFVLVEENGRLRLRWRQEGSDVVFPADALSDGTLRFICLATLLSLPVLPNLVVLDEPELGLHPYAIVQLAEMLRAASRESQVLIATQSVTLMNQFEVEDLIVVERAEGASVFDRPDRTRLHDWLAEYSLGELWEKNLLGGRPQTEAR
ncbi:chromosome segregation protein SMC [Sphaerisporangium melleum]|uniref:Chromosome segregation protein SMC n=1 Tax=Sphaerisporangium melleum TaxID=321316 RepID=A0A917VCT8_9ACTN|nr:AAA family ATPase [Sphaerisporangium melleum]GGK63448.1 chromosome segregation protein SMC [Sphaerisporangium melleum]GII68086.1 chromosome segregation protein SMC [Sphaerisporangium melleum]